jgi:hypothetical protein
MSVREVVTRGSGGTRSERNCMSLKKLTVVAVGVLLALVAIGPATATAAPRSRVTIKSVSSFRFKINRYIQDGLRWNRDAYAVRSGGTVHVVNGEGQSGPHTLTVLRKKDLPRTLRTLFNCRACNELTRAHGADPESEEPPRFPFLENGVGQDTPPDLDRPGDSGLIGPRRGDAVNFNVTARAGTTLWFICLIHPWMQAKLQVQGAS